MSDYKINKLFKLLYLTCNDMYYLYFYNSMCNINKITCITLLSLPYKVIFDNLCIATFILKLQIIKCNYYILIWASYFAGIF